ncbi:MAG: fibrillarin-like rRNA/tRNA 2'-O-methyltransferase [archaeon]
MRERLEVRAHDNWSGIYWLTLEDGTRRLATRNLVPGKSVYGERLLEWNENEYRLWDADRSKLAAAIIKNISSVPIRPFGRILYLGAASGTTASHVSDIVGEQGAVYCVEFSARVMRELIASLCGDRPNIYPILEDVRFPERYRQSVGQVDAIYCDVAQPEQAKIVADNADTYLEPNSGALLAIKSRSIDVTKSPSQIFKKEIATLESRGFSVKSNIRLEPFDQDHAMVSMIYKET